MQTSGKKRVFSGIQPSGTLHLGNYLGAIRQWADMQDAYDCIFCVVDYHAITVRQNPKELKRNIIDTAKVYLAAGIDPKKSVIFQQSDISAHAELAWILNTITRMSDLFKMTQFKDKTKVDLEKIYTEIEKRIIENSETQIISSNINKQIKALSAGLDNMRKSGVGLFDYPVLMAADILLYDTDVVPVGEDQKQHVELARDLARRFNHQFGETFRVPEAKVLKEGARIMGLDDPTKKMSKSAKSEYNYVSLTDAPEMAAKKIVRAATDSGREIKYGPEKKPGISNLLATSSLLTGRDIKDLEKQYAGRGYGDFKKDLAGEVKSFLAGFQNKLKKISDQEVASALGAGADKIRPIAEKTLKKAKEGVGVA